MSRIQPQNNEYYHVYNHGVEKVSIIFDILDAERFLQSMEEFNSVTPIGSLYEYSFCKDKSEVKEVEKLVDIVAYCLNPNHYHILLRQVSDNGISEFMKRLGGGYTSYFNSRYHRRGVLFQGRYKIRHIDTNEYLLYVSAYINLNNRVHQLSKRMGKLVKSSWDEYVTAGSNICNKDIILGQFKTSDEYKKYALNALDYININKKKQKELAILLLE